MNIILNTEDFDSIIRETEDKFEFVWHAHDNVTPQITKILEQYYDENQGKPKKKRVAWYNKFLKN